MAAARDIEGTSATYDHLGIDFDAVQLKAWGARQDGTGETMAGVTATQEDYAVAGLLWDKVGHAAVFLYGVASATAGILGLFVGATLLALGYEVFMGWVDAQPAASVVPKASNTLIGAWPLRWPNSMPSATDSAAMSRPTMTN